MLKGGKWKPGRGEELYKLGERSCTNWGRRMCLFLKRETLVLPNIMGFGWFLSCSQHKPEPALLPCILQLGTMEKHWLPYFFSYTGANTCIPTPLKRWQPVSSASPSWFEMAVCSAASSVKSVLPQALNLHLQFNFTFSWQWHKCRRKYYFNLLVLAL